MLRALGFAVAAHVLLMIALTWGINWKRDPDYLSAEAELWSRLPQEAAPKLVEVAPPPPPAPVPAPPPAPAVAPPTPAPEPAPRAADIALEREKEDKAEARRKLLALEREKKREEKNELAAQKLQAEKERLAQRKLEDRKLDERKALEAAKEAAQERQKLETSKKLRQADDAKRLEAQRETNLRRIQGMANSTGSESARGTAARSAAPSGTYGGRVAARVKPNIVFGEEIAGNPTAEVEVRTAPDGTIVSQRISKSSGVRSWDEAVLKAVIKTEVLPRDIDGRVPSSLIISFRPKD
jgi:colicin import membrane protein